MGWLKLLLPFLPKAWTWWHKLSVKTRYTYLTVIVALLVGYVAKDMVDNYNRTKRLKAKAAESVADPGGLRHDHRIPGVK